MLESLDKVLGTVPALTLVVGVVLLLTGGHSLVEGAVRIARRLGVSTLLIGLTVVAFGTSAPELAFNITAALEGSPELSFGNVVGSNIANIALVLGVTAAYRRLDVHSRVIKLELPLLIVVSLGMAALAWAPYSRLATPDGGVPGFSRLDGVTLLVVMGLCTWAWYRLARKDRRDPLTREAIEEADAEPVAPLPWALALFAVGLVALIAGGKATQIGAVAIAKSLGVGEALIGLTIVAVATSLPELVTTVFAARKGHTDLAIGNVVGSNMFNILLVLGATAALAPVPVPAGGWWDLAAMIALTLVLLPISITHQRRITRREGAMLIVMYVAYLTFRVLSATA